jgi:predicted dehydrogenase
MRKINTAVVGVGYLGRYHAEKLATLPQSNLVAVCDIDAKRCEEIAQKYNAQSVTDYQSLIGLVDAVCIVVPTRLHHQIGNFFLSHGVHVLLEKPIATNLMEADDLITTAHNNKALLQIGHLERFNNVIKALDPILQNPLFIESVRLAPFKLRGTDVNVIADLMIHDIDIIQSLVKSRIKKIDANGAPVLSKDIDIANARIEFDNGCVANVTASRVSLKIERRLRIFQHDCYISLDLDSKKISVHRKGPHEMFPGIPEIINESHTLDQGDALKEEISAFLNSILESKPAVVSGEDGKRALATAIEISDIIYNQLNQLLIREQITQ